MAKSIHRYIRLMHVRSVRPSAGLWSPAADIFQRGNGWIVKLDLAGVIPDDVQICISGNTLRVSGVRRDTSFGEGIAYHQLEITYSRFEKILQFPCSIEGARVSRDYRDGLLILELRGGTDCEEEG